MERIKIKLPNERSQQAVNQDLRIKIELEGDGRTLPVGEINRVLDVGKQFNKERQNSTCYRLLCTIRPLFTNVLFNTTGPNSWAYLGDYNSPLRDGSFPTNPPANPEDEEEDLTFRESIEQNLIEKNGWFGYIDTDYSTPNNCVFIDMEPNRSLFELTPKNKIKNWELTITYPALNTDTEITTGGLLIVEMTPVVLGNRPMMALATPVKHGLSQGQRVRVSGLSNPTYDGIYTVARLGLDNGDLKEYYFVIDIDTTTTGVNISGNSRMARIYANRESVYYMRKFKKVPTKTKPVIEDGDYELYPLPFSRGLFNDKVYQFVINEDIDVAGLVDNLGRPVSELYLTLIKTDSNQGQGAVFTEVKSGIEMPFIGNVQQFPTQVPDIRRIHNGTIPTSHTPLDTNVKITDDEFFGDVVEYNVFELREHVLGEVRHRFNTVNREAGGTVATSTTEMINLGERYEGYFYKPHHKIQIREFSNYIEQGDSSTFGIPDYAEDLGDGRFIWRDLLDIGVSNTSNQPLNYPFLNGCHYIHQNYCFALRRQDPYGQYGLIYVNFPRDSFGDRMTDNFVVNRTQRAC